ncbi:hypothetical protein BJ875DRAFT_14408 [Amylocarpus encephaloides]|uniref:Zn(2)-C6 fungal-type domain-containing protein n=1 Tax=Amylocarpus encephaloides TaxID=45428 RepID=A0A9P8C9S6_9HELO|nr:hypothetical protein BJ875DRAFT_14408 [Amylocarpus encephaloides]
MADTIAMSDEARINANKSKRPGPAERKRVKTSKVRTGCRTCKSRRVKCDEARPACLRCLRIGKDYCKGYEYTNISRHSAQKRILLPLAPQNDPIIQRFNSQDELSSFRLYCEKVAPKLSFNTDSVWQKLLLQAGQENEFIRNAIFAIGGFSQRSRLSASRGSGEGYTGVDSVKFEKAALAQYGKFLEGTKRYISRTSKEEGRRVAMISCLLVICIENMQYRPHNALLHAQQGLKLVEEITDDDSDIRQVSNAPEAIEVELMQQFGRLDLQVVGCYDVQPKEVHYKLKNEGNIKIRNMPETFQNVDEACLYLDLVMRRTFHFMAYTNSDHKVQFNFGLEDDIFQKSFCSREETDLLPAPHDVHVEQARYTAEVLRWNQAFEPLFADVLWNPHHPDSIRALMMKVHSLTTTLSLADHLKKSELQIDNFLPEMESLVYFSKKLLEHPHYVRGEFAFDMGLIYPLIIPTLNCRDRKLRREAIDLLAVKPWREAHWDSGHAADVARLVMQVEEEGVETDFIPEWARVRSFSIDIKMETGIAHLTCLRGVGDSAVRVKGVLDWSST